MIAKTKNFINEVVTELKKVSWSTKNELISSTIAVIILVAMLAVFIGMCDLLLSKAVDFVIRWSI